MKMAWNSSCSRLQFSKIVDSGSRSLKLARFLKILIKNGRKEVQDGERGRSNQPQKTIMRDPSHCLLFFTLSSAYHLSFGDNWLQTNIFFSTMTRRKDSWENNLTRQVIAPNLAATGCLDHASLKIALHPPYIPCLWWGYLSRPSLNTMMLRISSQRGK